MLDIRHKGLRDAEAGRNHGLRLGRGENFGVLLARYIKVSRVAATLWACRPSFLVSVMRVFRASSEPKVRRVDTAPVVALMADTQTLSDGTIEKTIGDTVRALRFPIHAELTISAMMNGRSPQPTFVGRAFSNLCHKAINHHFMIPLSLGSTK